MTRFGIKPPPSRRRAAIIWFAFVALLSHVLSPAVLMVAAGMLNPGGGIVKLTLCSAASENHVPGKAEPGFPVHHCDLCTVPTAELYRPQTEPAFVCEIAGAAYPRPCTNWSAAPLRHGQVQARGPPAVALIL